METTILLPNPHETLRDRDMRELRPYSLFNSNEGRAREIWGIVAAARDGAIGRRGEIPWRLREDLRHFKELTMGHPVIMGRRTWESLPRRPLPGRRNIVLSRRPGFRAEGAEVFTTAAEAISACGGSEIPFIIGGAELYAAALPFCTRIFLTEVDTTVEDADAFFPALPAEEWRETGASETMTSESGLRYLFRELRRR